MSVVFFWKAIKNNVFLKQGYHSNLYRIIIPNHNKACYAACIIKFNSHKGSWFESLLAKYSMLQWILEKVLPPMGNGSATICRPKIKKCFGSLLGLRMAFSLPALPLRCFTNLRIIMSLNGNAQSHGTILPSILNGP